MDIFLIYFIVKILMFDWKDQKYSIKETGDDPFKKHFAYVLHNFKFWVKSNISGTKVLQKTIIESQFNRFESDQNRSFLITAAVQLLPELSNKIDMMMTTLWGPNRGRGPGP